MAATAFIVLTLIFWVILWLAAAEDLRVRRLPNLLSLAALGLWPFAYAAGPDRSALLLSLGIPALLFAAGFALWSMRFLGGGDVKLLAVTALWVGPEQTLVFLVATGIAGGALALLALKLRDLEPMLLHSGGAVARRSFALLSSPAAKGAIELPYGLAIAIGGSIALYQQVSALIPEMI